MQSRLLSNYLERLTTKSLASRLYRKCSLQHSPMQEQLPFFGVSLFDDAGLI